MPEVIQFKADDYDKDAVLSLIDAVREIAERGEVLDVAIATVERGGDGEPMIMARHYGGAQYGSLVGAVDALKFDMHFRRYADDD